MKLGAEQIVEFVREALVVMDPGLVVLLANRPFYEKFQVTAEETIGKSIFDLGDRQWDIPQLRALLGNVVADGISFEGFQVNHEFERIGKRRILLNARKVSPGRDAGELVLLAFEDLTRRTEAEKRVDEYEGRFRLIFESVKDFSIFTTDLDGVIDSWNTGAENVFGYREGEILGQGFATIFTPEDRAKDAPRTELARAAREGRAVDERWHLKKDGSRFYASGMVTPLTDEEGALIGFTKVARDITAAKEAGDLLKEQAEALHDEHRRKDEFLATLAHELRNPLAAIGGAVSLLRLGGSGARDLDWGREVIDRQVVQLTRLIDDLLDVSRISTGKIHLKRELFDLRDVIHLVVESLRPLVASKRHELVVTLPESPVAVDGDPARLQQAIGNLVTNAAKYTDVGGRIELSTTLDGDAVEVKVKDTGVGIPADMLPRIFGLFTQVDSSLGRSQGGLGIGLSLVQNLVELHGGSVNAASDGDGLGSEFTIRLPVRPHPGPKPGDADSGRKPAVAPPPGPAGPRRVLVVDDNLDTARGMARFLKLSGHEVEMAHDGPSALLVARDFLPEVILLDIGLPGMSGYELARALRGDERLANSTFVAVSGYGQEKDLDAASASGFDHHMLKPIDVDLLLGLITRI